MHGNFASFRCKMMQQFTAWFFIHDRDHSDHCPAHVDVALPSVRIVCIYLIGAPAGNWESGLGRKAYEASKVFFLHVSRTFFLHMHLQPGLLKAISLMNLQQNHVKLSLMRLTESVPTMAKIILAKTIVSIARDLLGTGLAESRSSRACSKVKTQDKHTHKDEDKDEDNTKTQTQNGSPRSARITPPCT